MKSIESRQSVSLILKILTLIFAVWGLIKSMFVGGFMQGSYLLLYYTLQSNIWIAVVDIIMIAAVFKQRKRADASISPKLYLLQEVFTVSITLTGVVYCCVLLPSFIAEGWTAKEILSEYRQIFLHVLVPLLSIIDLLVFTRCPKLRKKQCFLAVLPAAYYLLFAAVGFFAKWDFGEGCNYPYFFLNYNSSVGMFGFGGEMPYFMGSFYWIIGLALFCCVVSLVYITIVSRLPKQKNNVNKV